MNKKVSYICLGLCMALSVDGFAAPRGGARRNAGGAKARTVSTSLVSGYVDKYFKNTSVTLVEKRSVALEPLMFPDSVSKITKTLSDDGKTTYSAQYGLCIPCSEVILEGEVPNGQGGYKFEAHQYTEGNSCYELNPNAKNYRLTTKSGAIDKCTDKIRMTIVDKRSSALPEIDSAILNIVPNSSAYDYVNMSMNEDTEIYDLIDNYTKAKQEAKDACSKGNYTLREIKNLIIGSTVSSGVATATGAVDTTIRTMNTATKDGDGNSNGTKNIDGVKNSAPQFALSVASGVGNVATAVTAFISVADVDKVIDDLKACKNAATRMHNAGIALEAGLEEMTSLD